MKQKKRNIIFYTIITLYLAAGYLPQIFQFTLGIIPICISLTYGFLAMIYAIRLLVMSPPISEFGTFNQLTKRLHQLLKTLFGISTFFISGLYGWYVSITLDSIKDIADLQNAMLDIVRTILQYCMAFLLLWIICLSIDLFRLSKKNQHSNSSVLHHGKDAHTSVSTSNNTIVQFLLRIDQKITRHYINNPDWFSFAFGLTLASAMTFCFEQLDTYLAAQISAAF